MEALGESIIQLGLHTLICAIACKVICKGMMRNNNGIMFNSGSKSLQIDEA